MKEEKLEREEQASRRSRDAADNERNQSISSNVDDKETDDMDDTENVIPKMTRAKAKALNQCPLPVASIHDVDSEVVALIREELHSDDDDEEYQPGEDDIEVSYWDNSVMAFNHNHNYVFIKVGRRYKYNNIRY